MTIDRARGFMRSQADRVLNADSNSSVGATRAELSRELFFKKALRGSKATQARLRANSAKAVELADFDAGVFALELLERVDKGVRKAFSETMVPLAENAVAQWPVGSENATRSRDGLVLSLRAVGDDTVEIIFTGREPWTFFVRYAMDDPPKYQGTYWQRVFGALRQSSEQRGGTPDYKLIAERLNVQPLGRGAVADLSPEKRLKRIWEGRTKAQNERKVYRTPDGRDAKGQHAWSTQARKPFGAVTREMAKIVGESFSDRGQTTLIGRGE